MVWQCFDGMTFVAYSSEPFLKWIVAPPASSGVRIVLESSAESLIGFQPPAVFGGWPREICRAVPIS